MKHFLSIFLLLCAPAFAAQVTFYVNAESPIASDSNSGLDEAHPFLTFTKGTQAAKAAKGDCSTITNPIIVIVHGKHAPAFTVYSFAATLTLTGTGSPNDSGCSASHPTVYKVPPGEQVILSGGRVITGASWICPRDPAAPQAGDVCTAQPTSPNLVNSEQLFLVNATTLANGTARRCRPRLGATAGGCTYTNYRVLTNTDLSNFEYIHTDPLVGFASFLNFNGAGGLCNVGVNTGNFPSLELELVIEEKWQEAHMRMCSATGNPTFIATMSGPLGASGNEGYFVGHRYFIENVLTGADIPTSLGAGNWYMDRRHVPFTLYYKVQSGENPHTDLMILPQGTPPVLQHLVLQNVQYYGFIFAHDNTVIPNAGFPAQQNNWNLEPNEFFQCLNCTNIDLIGNTVTQTVGLGVAYTTDATVSSGLNQNQLMSNSCYDAGSGCFYLGQFIPSLSDTDANVLSGTIVRNNKIRGIGRFFAGECGICILMSHDVYDGHNEISFTYGTATTHCIPSNANCHGGNGSSGTARQKVQDNLAYNITQGVLGDSSAACWYIVNYQALGVTSYRNICHDVSGSQLLDATAAPPGNGGHGNYWDNISCCGVVKDNLTYRVSRSAWKNTRSIQTPFSEHVLVNNIFAYSRESWFENGTQALLGANGQPNRQEVAYSNYLIADRDNGSTPQFFHQQSCTAYATVAGLIPEVQRFDKNVLFNSKTAIGAIGIFTLRTNSVCGFVSNQNFAGWQSVLGGDLNSTIASSNPFVNPLYPVDNFALSGAPLNGFVPFAFTAGLDSHSQPPVPATVPDTRIVSPFNPATDF